MAPALQTHEGRAGAVLVDQPLRGCEQLAEAACTLSAEDGSVKEHETLLFGDWQRSGLYGAWSPEIVQVE